MLLLGALRLGYFSSATRKEKIMRTDGLAAPEIDKFDVATEVLASAFRVLQAVGFSEDEVPKLFEQVAKKSGRGPIWINSV
jgi:hypothetical protein